MHKLRTHYLFATVLHDGVAKGVYSAFLNRIAEIRIEEKFGNKEFKMWVYEVEKQSPHLVRIRLEIVDETENTKRQDAMIQKFRGKLGELMISHRDSTIRISNVRDG
jgi:hypothetical protein